MIFLERTREGHRHSDRHWIHFKGNVGDTSERQGGVPMGFSECYMTRQAPKKPQPEKAATSPDKSNSATSHWHCAYPLQIASGGNCRWPCPEIPLVYCPASHPFRCQQSGQSRCLLRKLLTRLVQALWMVDMSAAVSGHLHWESRFSLKHTNS